MRAAAEGLIDDMTSSPFGAGDTISAVVESVRIEAVTRAPGERRNTRRP